MVVLRFGASWKWWKAIGQCIGLVKFAKIAELLQKVIVKCKNRIQCPIIALRSHQKKTHERREEKKRKGKKVISFECTRMQFMLSREAKSKKKQPNSCEIEHMKCKLRSAQHWKIIFFAHVCNAHTNIPVLQTQTMHTHTYIQTVGQTGGRTFVRTYKRTDECKENGDRL